MCWGSVQQAQVVFPPYYYNCGWKLYALRRLLSLLYTVVIAKMVEGNIVGKVEKWRNGRRLLHRQSGDQLMVTGHRHTIVITQIHLTGCTNTLSDNNNIIHIIECSDLNQFLQDAHTVT